MKKRDPETRYRENIRKQQRELEEYAAHEIEWANDLLLWYRARKEEIPDEEYRAAAFFINREYRDKRGALTSLYLMYQRCNMELPLPTRETMFYHLAYRFKVYAEALKQGGY
jgi:hypothetical protein